jgi:hypothetical protein
VSHLLITEFYITKCELRVIQNGNWDTDSGCVSSGNQGLCWDIGDMLGWRKAQGRAETSTPWTLAHWRLLHLTIHWKNSQAALPRSHHPHAGPPGSRPAGPPGHPTPALQAAVPLGHQPTGLPPTTGGFQHHQTLALNSLGDTDKQDWMLKE